MRKANKIMMTVSILLCLVLITSTVMSSTLAKYVTTGSASSSTARVAKWGVTVEATPDPDLVNMATNKATYDENSVGFVFEGIQLAPGDSFYKAVNFKISGNAEVRLMIKIIIDVSYNTGYGAGGIGIYNGTAGVDKSADGEAGDSYLPIVFYYSADEAYQKPNRILTPYYTGVHYNAEIAMQKNLCKLMDVRYDNDSLSSKSKGSNPGHVYKIFEPNQDIVFHPVTGCSYNATTNKFTHTGLNKNVNITEFDLGFDWPMTWPESGTTEIDYDEMSMFFNNHRNPTITANFKVVIEQIN